MGVLGDVEYGYGDVERVGEDVVLVGVSDCVMPYRGVSTYGGGEMGCVLGYVCMWGWIC